MKKFDEMDAPILKRAKHMINECNFFCIASITDDGYPRVCAVSNLLTDFPNTLIFSTGSNGVKAQQFRKNPKASACIVDGPDSITFLGCVTEVSDPVFRKKVWQPQMIEHFSGGTDDSNYCFFAFKAFEAVVWINGHFAAYAL